MGRGWRSQAHGGFNVERHCLGLHKVYTIYTVGAEVLVLAAYTPSSNEQGLLTPFLNKIPGIIGILFGRRRQLLATPAPGEPDLLQ